MVARSKTKIAEASSVMDGPSTSVLGPDKERRLVADLAECKRRLSDQLAKIPGMVAPPTAADDPRAMSRFIAEAHALSNTPPFQSLARSEFQRYFELRSELAMANMRLVASIAKRFAHRGVAYSDLLQEGFCGLLEAIDRFEADRQTKLSTYATWWIRQAVQAAVAAGAYPVRLSPRHLRQLAQNQEGFARNSPAVAGPSQASNESLQRIQAATRPALSLDESRYASLPSMDDSDAEITDGLDVGESLDQWMKSLRPRERLILSYRFGLGGNPRLSLSQVGKVMAVSKERVRQIQEVALRTIHAHLSHEKGRQSDPSHPSGKSTRWA